MSPIRKTFNYSRQQTARILARRLPNHCIVPNNMASTRRTKRTDQFFLPEHVGEEVPIWTGRFWATVRCTPYMVGRPQWDFLPEELPINPDIVQDVAQKRNAKAKRAKLKEQVKAEVEEEPLSITE